MELRVRPVQDAYGGVESHLVIGSAMFMGQEVRMITII
jgi:hypothetical protein